ncbi:MFS transporter [Jatrophihabitans sp.]|uniref:MFS transporter n=1 Tax=Jatrophihabitans sp. TaxID=1932789 RepID=UPI0030C6B126|nr:Major facilitator superfamily 1 [Jatrophihabitans sp.]
MSTPSLTSPTLITTEDWRGRALVPVLVFVGLLIAVVSSLGSPLIPTIATDYGVSLGTAQWSLTITLLVGAITSPVVGRMGDGPRRLPVLLVSLGILVVGSVLAALPGTVFALLIVGRAMQGVGLALLPLAMSVARDHLSPKRSRSTLATLSVTAVVGVGLGYPITGLIAEHLDLHAGFWMAAGLGVLAMVLVALVVPQSVHRPRQVFDVPGALLLGLALAGLLIAISESDDWGWTSGTLWGLAAASVALVGIWVWHELRTAEPLVDLRLLRHRTVLTANSAGLIAGIGMYMLMTMIIRYVQTPTAISYGLGASVVVGGLVLLPMSAFSFGSSKLVTYLGRWATPGQILPLGVLTLALSLLLFATGRGSLWEIFVIMGIGGVGIGSSFAVMPRMIVSSVPAEETSSALALNQVLRTIGYSMGSAVTATILTAHTSAGAKLPTNSGYTVGALVAIGLLLVAAALSWLLPERRTPRPLTADDELEILEDTDAAISGTITLDEGVESTGRVHA